MTTPNVPTGAPDAVPVVVPVIDPSTLPPLPDSPSQTQNTRSDYRPERGSAAAVDGSTTVVAPRAKSRRGRGRTAEPYPTGGKSTQSRSRSEERETRDDPVPGASFMANQMQLMKVKMDGLLVRISTVEATQQAGHDVINGFAQNLEERNAKVDQKLLDLQSSTEAHLGTVEETFRRCGQALEELKTATQAASSAAAHALASSTGASSSGAASPGMTRPDLNQLNKHLDTSVAAVQEQITRMECQLVAHRLDSQSEIAAMTSEIATVTNLVLTAGTSVRELDAKNEASEAALRAQIQTTIVRVEKGLCQCPNGCPGRTDASKDADKDPFAGSSDPWRPKGSPPPGGGPPGAGGGGDGDGDHGDGADFYGIGSDDGTKDKDSVVKKLTKASKSPFDTKDAKDNVPRYDGRTKREYWRKMVSYYLYSKVVDMGALLKWTEQQKVPITPETIAEAQRTGGDLNKLVNDPDVLAHFLWGFLNISLTDDAWEIFDNVEVGEGLEVWRLVNVDTTQKTEGELMEMEDLVQNPKRLVKLTDISKGILAWDIMYKEFKEAGGEKVSPAREVNILAKMLPGEFKQHALWEFAKFKNDPTALRSWIKEKVRDLVREVPDTGKHAAHLLGESGGEDEDRGPTAEGEIFDNVEAGEGLEVWRLVNVDTTQKTEGELMEMEDLVQNPKRLVKLTDISKGILAWDIMYKEFKEAGGEKVSPAREVNILAKMLPGEFKQHALWEFAKFKNDPTALRSWIKEKVRDLVREVPDTGKHAAHLLGESGGEDEDRGPTAEEFEAMTKEELIMAFTGGKRPFFKNKFQKSATKAPPRDVADLTCPNCNEKGHTGQDCKKPKIDMKDRKCFICGKRAALPERAHKRRLWLRHSLAAEELEKQATSSSAASPVRARNPVTERIIGDGFSHGNLPLRQRPIRRKVSLLETPWAVRSRGWRGSRPSRQPAKTGLKGHWSLH